MVHHDRTKVRTKNAMIGCRFTNDIRTTPSSPQLLLRGVPAWWQVVGWVRYYWLLHSRHSRALLASIAAVAVRTEEDTVTAALGAAGVAAAVAGAMAARVSVDAVVGMAT